jgi:glycosyltransferase involved in cell wall biosynthesis
MSKTVSTVGQDNLKIGLVSPYLDTLGGGERYLWMIASCLARENHVDIFWNNPLIKTTAEEKFGLELKDVSVKSLPKDTLSRLLLFKNYDLIFYMTDGSLFFSPAKKNILIVQSPAHIPPQKSLISRLKIKNWQILCYSDFMAKIIKEKLKRQAKTLFVPVDLKKFKAKPKEDIILSVGRFFSQLHNKKQDTLVDVFKSIVNQIPSWKLYLAGSVDQGGGEYLNFVKKKADIENIEILTKLDFNQLVDLYSRAKIFWHAAGFGEDLKNYPEKAEHFGVVTVEAMASGVVPLVFNGGGQSEIVSEESYCLWKTKEELKEKTLRLVNNEHFRETLAKKALIRAQDFSLENFSMVLYEIIK